MPAADVVSVTETRRRKFRIFKWNFRSPFLKIHPEPIHNFCLITLRFRIVLFYSCNSFTKSVTLKTWWRKRFGAKSSDSERNPRVTFKELKDIMEPKLVWIAIRSAERQNSTSFLEKYWRSFQNKHTLSSSRHLVDKETYYLPTACFEIMPWLTYRWKQGIVTWLFWKWILEQK